MCAMITFTGTTSVAFEGMNAMITFTGMTSAAFIENDVSAMIIFTILM